MKNKHVKETLGQFNDFQFFSLLEGKRAQKINKDEEKMKNEDAKLGAEVIKKIHDNFERFKSAAGEKIIKYKEFWGENNKSKEAFDAEGQVYKMFDSDYIVGTLMLPDEAISDEEIDAEIEDVDKDPDAKDTEGEESTEETPEKDTEETPEEEETEEVPEETPDFGSKKSLVKESLNEGADLNLDFDEPSDDDERLGAEEPIEEPSTGSPEETDLEEPSLDGEETPDIGGEEGEDITGDETIEEDPGGDPDMEFKDEEGTNEYFVVYNMTGEEREEVFRTDSTSVIDSFKDFFENSFKGAMKEQILKFKQAQEDKKKEAELAAKEKKREERKGKLDQFMKA